MNQQIYDSFVKKVRERLGYSPREGDFLKFLSAWYNQQAEWKKKEKNLDRLAANAAEEFAIEECDRDDMLESIKNGGFYEDREEAWCEECQEYHPPHDS